MPSPIPARRGTAIACALLSGVSALVAEVAWIRLASLAFGATTPAVATVLATFFGGLALGHEAFGRLSLRVARPLRLYALAETLLALLVAASPWVLAALEPVYGAAFDPAPDAAARLTALRAGLVAAAILAPTVLMGASLPLLARRLVVEDAAVGRGSAILYGVNTAGALAGALLATFATIPVLGLRASLIVAAAANLLAAVLAWRAARALEPLEPVPPRPGGAVPGAWTLLGVVALTGFVTLGTEVVWARFLALLMRNTVHTYGVTLSVVLAGLVIGALVSAPFQDAWRRRPWLLAAVLVLHGLSTFVLMTRPASPSGAIPPLGTQWRTVAGLMLVPAVLLGLAFPMIVRAWVDRAERAGLGLGRVTACNTAGGIAGSLVTGFVAVPGLGMHGTLVGLCGLSVVAGVLVVWRLVGGSPLARAVGAVAAWGAFLALVLTAPVRLPHDYLAPEDRLVAVHEGTASNLAVVDRGGVPTLEIDRLWQGEAGRSHQVLAGWIPMVLHPRPAEVLVIGLGAGQAPRAVLEAGAGRLAVVDIEPGLFDLVREHFDGAWLDDARVRTITEDGRAVVAHLEHAWDLVAIEVGQTFRPGVAGFYTRDFYEQVAARLAPGGLACQFVPLDFLDPDELAAVLATFLEVFPNALLWFNTTELLLIGGVEPWRIPRERLALLGTEAAREALDHAYWGDPELRLREPGVFVGGLLAGARTDTGTAGGRPAGGLAALAAGGAILRDDRPVLDYAAATRAPDADEALLELLSAHLDDPAPWFEPPLDEELAARAREVRALNLADVPARALCRRAFDLQADGDVAASIPLLERARAINPRSVRALELLGWAYTRQGRDADALEVYEEAVRISPRDPELMRHLGSQWMKAGRFADATQALRAAVELGDEGADTRALLGAALMKQARVGEAVEAFEAALARDPDDRAARMNLAIALSGSGRAREAVDAYAELLARDPDHVEARYNLGVVLGRLGDLDGAIAAYDAVLEREPDMARAHVNLGNALSARGEVRRAIEHFRRATALEPHMVEAHHNLVVLLARSGRWDEAEPVARRTVELAPRLAGAHLELGRVLAALGRGPEAVSALEQAARLEPGSPEIEAALAAARAGRPLPATR